MPFDPFTNYNEANQTAEAAAIWIDSGGWDEASIPRRPWITPGYLLRGSVTLLTGPAAALKSTAVLGWGTSLALGADFGRFRPVKPCKLIVYNVEDDRDEQRRRLSATLRQFDATPDDIIGKVFRVGPNSIGTLLARDSDGKLMFTPAMAAVEKLITAEKPDVLIVDPLAELHSEEENDNTALRAVIAAFRALAVRYQMAIVILHHTRKGSALSPGDPDTARGGQRHHRSRPGRVDPHRHGRGRRQGVRAADRLRRAQQLRPNGRREVQLRAAQTGRVVREGRLPARQRRGGRSRRAVDAPSRQGGIPH